MIRHVALALVLVFSSCGTALAAPTGYVGRDCGFDNDRDGNVGEAGECDYCDTVTTDPDQDGQDERQVYVHCGTGVDDGSCGTPGSPCASIDYALNTRGPAMAGSEEIIACVLSAGCELIEVPMKDGAGGTSFTTATGSYQGEPAGVFRFADEPNSIIGADADNDGSYPPFDADDACEILGHSTSGRVYGLVTPSDQTERFRFAHCSVKDYASYANNPVLNEDDSRGFMDFTEGVEFFEMHDIESDGVLKDQPKCGNTIPFRMFMSDEEKLRHFVVRNTKWDNQGGFGFRGGLGSGTEEGPILWGGVTYIGQACTDGACNMVAKCAPNGGNSEDLRNGIDFFKLWGDCCDGPTNGVWLANAIINSGAGSNYTTQSGSASQAIVLNDNLRNIHVQNASIEGFKIGIAAQPDKDGSGIIHRNQAGNTIRDVTFKWSDAAVTQWTNSSGKPVQMGINFQHAKTGDGSIGHIGDVTIDNVACVSGTGGGSPLRSCVYDESGTFSSCGSSPSSVTIRGLTVNATLGRGNGLLQFGDTGTPPDCPNDNVRIEGVVLEGEDGAGDNTCIRFEPEVVSAMQSLSISDVSASAGCQYQYTSKTGSIATFAGQDAAIDGTNMQECTTTFLADGYHLDSGDTCSRNAGGAISGLPLDIDGDARVNDIGVDEEGGSPGTTTTTTTLPVCGNGTLEGAEQCDDGNLDNGDCCNSGCNFESTGAGCDDGVFCTATDTCNAAGGCVGVGDPCFAPQVCNESSNACEDPPDPEEFTVVCDFVPDGGGPTSGGDGYDYRSVCRGNPAGAGANQIRVVIGATSAGSGCEINALTLQKTGCTTNMDCGQFASSPITVTDSVCDDDETLACATNSDCSGNCVSQGSFTANPGGEMVSDWEAFSYDASDVWIHAVLGVRDCYEADDDQMRFWLNTDGSTPGHSALLDPVGTLSTTTDSIVVKRVEVRTLAGATTTTTLPAPVCGNATVEAGEQCDDGNTDTGDCCNATCQLDTIGAACGAAGDTVCDDPDTCDGAGICLANNETSGTACDDGAFCNGADTCDGLGACQSAGDPCAAPGTACNETGNSCDSTGSGSIQIGR